MRTALGDEMKKRAPYNVYLNMKSNVAEAGIDLDPAHLPKLDTLRKIRSEGRRKPADVIGELFNFAQSSEFIQSLQIHPEVFISFWSREQINFYNAFSKDNFVVMSLDDTSDVVQNITPGSSNKKKMIKMFSCVIKIKGSTLDAPVNGLKMSSVPVNQLLSTKADIPAVKNWLADWKPNVTRPPDLLVMDGAAVLHYSACLVFNDCELKEYYENAWRSLRGEKSRVIRTLLRIDRSHFVQTIVRWLKTNKASVELKELVARALCRLIDEKEFEIVVHVFVHLLFITLDSTATDRVNMAKEGLLNFITGVRPEGLQKIDHDDLSLMNQNWFSNIVVKARQEHCSKGTGKNFLRIPKLIDYLIYLSRRIFLWTDVYTSHVGCKEQSPNSNNIESFFNKYKNTILQGDMPDLDVFMKGYKAFLEGELVRRNSKF